MPTPTFPEVLIVCESCEEAHPEYSAHKIDNDNVAWDGRQWLCWDCYGVDRVSETSWKNAPTPWNFLSVNLRACN